MPPPPLLAIAAHVPEIVTVTTKHLMVGEFSKSRVHPLGANTTTSKDIGFYSKDYITFTTTGFRSGGCVHNLAIFGYLTKEEAQTAISTLKLSYEPMYGGSKSAWSKITYIGQGSGEGVFSSDKWGIGYYAPNGNELAKKSNNGIYTVEDPHRGKAVLILKLE